MILGYGHTVMMIGVSPIIPRKLESISVARSTKSLCITGRELGSAGVNVWRDLSHCEAGLSDCRQTYTLGIVRDRHVHQISLPDSPLSWGFQSA